MATSFFGGSWLTVHIFTLILSSLQWLPLHNGYVTTKEVLPDFQSNLLTIASEQLTDNRPTQNPIFVCWLGKSSNRELYVHLI